MRRFRPMTTRRVVDFPAPLGPRNPVTAPALASKVRSSTARREPCSLVSARTLITVVPSWVGGTCGWPAVRPRSSRARGGGAVLGRYSRPPAGVVEDMWRLCAGPRRWWTRPSSGDAELVALGVEHDDVPERHPVVGVLAHPGRPGSLELGDPLAHEGARARPGPTAARRRPGCRRACGSWPSCPRGRAGSRSRARGRLDRRSRRRRGPRSRARGRSAGPAPRRTRSGGGRRRRRPRGPCVAMRPR